MARRAPYRKREEVREEIIRAAEELLATRSPSEVSLREIATHGGFQHSLITRHFGTKDELVAEVVQRTLASYVDAISGCDDPVEGFLRGMEHVATHPASYHAMARALIDETRGSTAEDPLAGFEIHRARLARHGAGASDEVDLDALTVALMAFTSGWAFMEDRWLRTGGYTDADRARVRAQVTELIRRLVDGT